MAERQTGADIPLFTTISRVKKAERFQHRPIRLACQGALVRYRRWRLALFAVSEWPVPPVISVREKTLAGAEAKNSVVNRIYGTEEPLTSAICRFPILECSAELVV